GSHAGLLGLPIVRPRQFKPAPTPAPTLGGRLPRAGAPLLAPGALAGDADFGEDAPGVVGRDGVETKEKLSLRAASSHGICLFVVSSITDLRTRMISSWMEIPWVLMCLRRALVKGLFRPLPSEATLSSCVA